VPAVALLPILHCCVFRSPRDYDLIFFCFSLRIGGMAANSGQCDKCGDTASYADIVCAGCGSRLPWAHASQTARHIGNAPTAPPTQALKPLPPTPRPTSLDAPDTIDNFFSTISSVKLPKITVFPERRPVPVFNGVAVPYNSNICEKCGFIGWPQKTGGYNFGLGCIFSLAGLLPGLIYTALTYGKDKHLCPKCHHENMVPTDTPGGVNLLNKFYS